jgi:hypothetical protein
VLPQRRLREIADVGVAYVVERGQATLLRVKLKALKFIKGVPFAKWEDS